MVLLLVVFINLLECYSPQCMYCVSSHASVGVITCILTCAACVRCTWASGFLHQYYVRASLYKHVVRAARANMEVLKGDKQLIVARVGGWICDGVPSSLWEQPGWARQAWMHGAGSHLALDGTPKGDTGWCQPSENTSSMFENDMFGYTVCSVWARQLCSCRAVTHSQILHDLHMFTVSSMCPQGQFVVLIKRNFKLTELL